MADSKDKKTDDVVENDAVENAAVKDDAVKDDAVENAPKEVSSSDAAAGAEGASAEKKAQKKPAAKKADAAKAAKKPAGKKAAAAGKKKTPPAQPATPVEPTFVRATARYVRSAPRKARLVVDHIRGESVEDARVFLEFTPRHVGRDVAKVLESAVANAEHNHELDGDSLHVVKAYVDEGPTLKRWRPRAKGRATQILKRTSHITVVVSDVPATDLKNRKAAA